MTHTPFQRNVMQYVSTSIRTASAFRCRTTCPFTVLPDALRTTPDKYVGETCSSEA